MNQNKSNTPKSKKKKVRKFPWIIGGVALLGTATYLVLKVLPSLTSSFYKASLKLINEEGEPEIITMEEYERRQNNGC